MSLKPSSLKFSHLRSAPATLFVFEHGNPVDEARFATRLPTYLNRLDGQPA